MKQFAFIVLFNFFLLSNSKGQCFYDNIEMSNISRMTLGMIYEFETQDEHKRSDGSNLSAIRMEIDLISEDFKVKESFRQFSAGSKYHIVAVGDYRISDIDISIRKLNQNGKWVKIAEDLENRPTATAVFIPTETCLYSIEITAASFKSGYKWGHYSLVVFL